MTDTLHITNGDSVGEILAQCGIAGDILVWRDILYDGPRKAGWPDEDTLRARARFLEDATGGGLASAQILTSLGNQYRRLAAASEGERIVLWFDACLFDQAMLVHILTCLDHHGIRQAVLLCVDSFPGIVPFNGLGQLHPDQLASLFHRRRPVTDAQFRFARLADRAFAAQDPGLFEKLAQTPDAPLPWVPAAVRRWLQEQPDPVTGLGRLETLALEAVRRGCESPADIFSAVAAVDTPPQYWGDTTLWAKLNALADREPALVRIEGPASRLPQWGNGVNLKHFRITPLPR